MGEYFEKKALFPWSPERGWRRSGLSARRRRGEPGPGSVDLGREKDFLLGVRPEEDRLAGWLT